MKATSFVNSEFKKESKEYNIIYKTEHVKLLQTSSFHAINDETNKILKTDFNIKDVSKINKLQDKRRQSFYIVRILETKINYEKILDGKPISKELFQIEYTYDAPKQEVHNTYNVKIDDHSTNIEKGAVASIHGGDVSKETTTNFNLGINKSK